MLKKSKETLQKRTNLIIQFEQHAKNKQEPVRAQE